MTTSCSRPIFDWTVPILPDEQEQTLPGAECSVWSWCPCDPAFNLSYCSRTLVEESCPMPDITDEFCAGAGGWYLVCGDGCLGPPCRTGDFYGEQAMVCRCPLDPEAQDATEWSLGTDVASMSCPGDEAPAQPHPWALWYGRNSYAPFEQVPTEIFPIEECTPTAKGWWTWCPCEGDDTGSLPHQSETLRAYTPGDEGAYALTDPNMLLGDFVEDGELNGKPKYTGPNDWCLWFDSDADFWTLSDTCGSTSGAVWIKANTDHQDCPLGAYTPDFLSTGDGVIYITPECPWDTGKCTANATGDGRWVFRGGCDQLGPPPVLGRYYGETIAIGHCCADVASLSSSSYEFSPGSSNSSCGPEMPAFEWFLRIQTQYWADSIPPSTVVCSISDTAGWWLWCQCPTTFNHSSSCGQVFGMPDDCPYAAPELIGDPTGAGDWAFIGGLDFVGAPPTQGRFYGEIIWFDFCSTPVSISSSSSSIPPEPPVDACQACPVGVAPTFEVSLNRTSDLNRSCSDCNTHFDSIANIPVTYQGTIAGGWHAWKSADDITNTTDCSNIFDEHDLWVLIRDGDPACELKIIYKHSANDIEDNFGKPGSFPTYYYGNHQGNVSTLCDAVDFTTDFFSFLWESADGSLNCWTMGFNDTITLHGIGA